LSSFFGGDEEKRNQRVITTRRKKALWDLQPVEAPQQSLVVGASNEKEQRGGKKGKNSSVPTIPWERKRSFKKPI